MGYVGFSVAFAFAIAALLGGKLDAAWARWSRPWTIVAWAFLGIGIALGSWWAYYELGWGGWWFWDPVENASFMPWLVGTALILSLIHIYQTAGANARALRGLAIGDLARGVEQVDVLLQRGQRQGDGDADAAEDGQDDVQAFLANRIHFDFSRRKRRASSCR